MPPPTASLAPLYDLAWRKLALTLRNTRNTFAREHPLSIFEAIFKTVARQVGGAEPLRFWFHPLDTPLADRMQKMGRYPLEVVFPLAPADQVARFAQGLGEYLGDTAHNFRLEDISAHREMNLAALIEDHPLPQGDCREACLEFLTPFPFDPPDPERRWLLEKPALAKAFVNRVRRFFDLDLSPSLALWEPVGVLPYYWRYVRHGHQAKSNGGVQFINGMQGPLYLKGELAPLLPLLLLGSELHIGRRRAHGQGRYVLAWERPFFDPRLREVSLWEQTWQEMDQDSDQAPPAPADPDPTAGQMRDLVAQGVYMPEPCQGHMIPKKSGQTRLVAELAPADLLVHRALLKVLEPELDRMFEHASLGYRRGKSRETALAQIRRALAQGLSWVVESDIESFFDQVDWGVLRARLDNSLPAGDQITRQTLEACLTCGLMVKGKRVERSRGLLQGSPLSPLLSNLYLDTFDEQMERLGYCLVRYADDFLVLVRDRAQGEQALAHMAAILEPLGLGLKGEKTAIRPLEGGVSFLGFDLGPDLEEELIENTSLRKPLFVTQPHTFVGVDHLAVVVRQDKQLLGRFPLARVSEIILFGVGAVSARLIEKCTRQKIPISFCTPAGYYITTLRPDSKEHFLLAGQHARRFAQLSPEERVGLAARLVAAKLEPYQRWIKAQRGPDNQALWDQLEEIKARLPQAPRVEVVRGAEARAARLVYGFVNGLVKEPAFASQGRRPRKKADPYNSLLDFAYSLLFSRINVLVRGRGLNPYLGLLHSHLDNYESLVADLQEPFRCRMDRMVVKLINRKVIKAEMFAGNAQSGYRLDSSGVKLFLEAFQRELALALVEDPGPLAEMISALVQRVKAWAQGANELSWGD